MFLVDLTSLVALAALGLILTGMFLVHLGSVGINYRTFRRDHPDQPLFMSAVDTDDDLEVFRYWQRYGFDSNVSAVLAGYVCMACGAGVLLKLEPVVAFVRRVLEAS